MTVHVQKVGSMAYVTHPNRKHGITYSSFDPLMVKRCSPNDLTPANLQLAKTLWLLAGFNMPTVIEVDRHRATQLIYASPSRTRGREGIAAQRPTCPPLPHPRRVRLDDSGSAAASSLVLRFCLPFPSLPSLPSSFSCREWD